MSDKLPPLIMPVGKRTEGTLLNEPVKRIVPKSPFLRKLEAQQKPHRVKEDRYDANDYGTNVLRMLREGK